MANWRTYAASGLLFLLLAGFVVGKALLIDDCFAHDTNDEVNHIFTGLYMAKKMLLNGTMPFYNYYNNFGTPLLGDALTYPFALQAIPYYLADLEQYPLVATVNKFVLCFLTLSILLIYYRTFNLSVFASTVTAICVFFNFSHFWFFSHHHYQATLLFMSAILVVQKTALSRDRYRLFAVVALLYALMFYSVSANLMLLCTPFLVLHTIFLRPTLKATSCNLAALFVGGALGGVQIIATAAAAMNSARAAKYFSDAFYIHFSWRELLLKLLFQETHSTVIIGHIYRVAYFPVFAIMAYGVGIYLLYRYKKTHELTMTLSLGLVPGLLVSAMLVNTGLWRAAPLLKSTDITRVLWIAMIFAGIGIGYFIDAAKKKVLHTRLIVAMLAIQAAGTLYLVQITLEKQTHVVYLFGYATALLFLSACLARHSKTETRYGFPITSGLLLGAILFTYSPIIYFLGEWSYPDKCISVNYYSKRFNVRPYRKIAEHIGEQSRFAIDIESMAGYELKIGIFNRHGGGGRSIMMDRKLNERLTSLGMIDNDDPLCGYHFEDPWDVATANRLGLGYYVAVNEEQHENWQIIQVLGGAGYLYENLQKPTLVSLRDEQNSIAYAENFMVAGNDLTIQLPTNKRAEMLVVAMTVRPGFSVTVDGVRRAFDTDDFGFFNIGITAADKIVKLSYNPLDLGLLL